MSGEELLPRAAPTCHTPNNPGPSVFLTTTLIQYQPGRYCQQHAWTAGPSGPFPRLCSAKSDLIVPVPNFVQRGTSSHLCASPLAHWPLGPLASLPPSPFCARNLAIHARRLLTMRWLRITVQNTVCYSSLLPTGSDAGKMISQPCRGGFNLETPSAPNTHPPAPPPPGQAPTYPYHVVVRLAKLKPRTHSDGGDGQTASSTSFACPGHGGYCPLCRHALTSSNFASRTSRW